LESDADYFARRAREEARAAAEAPNPLVVEVHLMLARKYRELAELLGGPRRTGT